MKIFEEPRFFLTVHLRISQSGFLKFDNKSKYIIT